MFVKQGLKLTPLAAAVSAALAPGGFVQAQEAGSSPGLEEIIVTARKREENLQTIPASIQAIGQETLEKMGANGIEDYTRFIPAVNVVNFEPGSSAIVFRGVYTGGAGVGQSPASLYLDELPLTVTGDQPEVRMVDINRVEALSGPQGTLFGGSAQSGTLRVITNQPDPTQFEAIASTTLKQGADTAFSHDVSGVLNLPFGEGRGAVRLVGFTATDAGFIDNVFGHTPDTHFGAPLPAEFSTEDNANVVEDDWNGVDYTGGRVALKYDFNDDWSGTVGYNYQKSEASGGSGNQYDPFAGDLQVIKFVDGFRDDEWSTVGLTLEGDLGWAQLVSATTFYSRESETYEDATVYQKYYQSWACLSQSDPAVYTGYFVDPTTGGALYYPRYCMGPTSLTDVIQAQRFYSRADKFAQEIRLQGGDDDLNWIVGLFYEKTSDDWESPWGIPVNYDYQDSISRQYWEWRFQPGIADNATHGWESQSQVEWEQKAVFGEFTWQINDEWSTTLGARYFDRTMDSRYIVENPNTVISSADFLANGVAIAEGGGTDFVPKINVSYQPTDDKMIYALYSEGFRPGGTNRGRGNPILPLVFEADKLQNLEIGAKTRWADGRVQVNLTYYDMTWKDYQLQVLDPSFADGEPWQQVIANVGDANVEGLQIEIDVAIVEGFNWGMNLTSLTSETATDVSIDSDPTTVEIPTGTRLPLAPEFKAATWLDFYWQQKRILPGSAFARLQLSHTGDSVNQIRPSATGANPQFTSPSYSIMDFRVGIATDTDWEVDLFISNLTDERAQYTRAAGYFEQPFSSVEDGRAGVGRIYTNRPREFGMRISKRWGE